MLMPTHGQRGSASLFQDQASQDQAMPQIEQAAPVGDVSTRTRGRHLTEPLIVSRFWRDRAHNAIVTELATFQGKNVVDVRMYSMHGGRLKPTFKGVSLSVLRLPDLARAVNKALRQAKDLGLLPDDRAGL
jgi:hypothetical protein